MATRQRQIRRKRATIRDACDDLEPIFRPRSIAVVGASSNMRKEGYEYTQGLVEIGFPGPIYPVNPKLDELLGLKAYPRLEDIPGPVDFIISTVPANAVLDVVEGAKARGTKLIHFYTARFSETGREDGAALERELRKRTKEAGIRVIGPNCMGLYYPKMKITFDPIMPYEPGNIGVLTQSGSHAFRVIGRGKDRGLRFSKVISYGNAMDLNEADLLDHFREDPDTDIIGAYIEGLHSGRRFFEALRRAAAKKPVVVMKGGRTAAGHAAASSHTAALAGEQAVWRAAVRQAGALEVDTINEFIDMLVTFRYAGPVKGPRVAVLGGAGGGMVESADLCQEAGLDVAPLPQEIREALRDKVPHAWDWVGNPVDGSILGWGTFNAMDVIEMMAASPAYDALIVTSHLDFSLNRDDGGKQFRETIDRLKKLGTESGKAAMLVVADPENRDMSRWKAVMEARWEMTKAGVALFTDIERAARTMGRYVQYMTQREGER